MQVNILFLTTHNFATNPRLVKEVELALKEDFSVQIICFEFENWSFKMNQEIKRTFEQRGVIIHTIDAGRNNFFNWLMSVALEKFGRSLSLFFETKGFILAQAVSRRNGLLISALKKITKPDWVVGHNPGTLAATVIAGRKFDCLIGFDVEDYHPGEGNNGHLQKLTRKLMNKWLPKFNYVSFASPLILKQVQTDLDFCNANWITVLNYFPKSQFRAPFTVNEGPVRLVWFSQNISAGRGLELILPYIKKMAFEVELHLIGHMNTAFYEQYLMGFPNIIIHPPTSQEKLHLWLADFDVGLALEPAKDLNNELAISNKILAYLQAGLYVVATKTLAQEALMDQHTEHGVCFDYKINNFEPIFKKILENKLMIRNTKSARYKNFSQNNWEMASLRLLREWNS